MIPDDLHKEITRLREENANLRSKLASLVGRRSESEEALHAIRRGEVDALVVQQEGQPEVIYALQPVSTLREREELNRLMIDGISDHAIFLVDPAGRVLNWNAGASQVFGYSEGEIVGQNRLRFFTPEDLANGFPQLELEQARAARRSTAQRWRVRKDGSRFWAEGTLTGLYEPGGGLRGFVNVVRDLTERKRAEEMVQASGERLGLAAQAANVALWEWNLETNAVRFSPEWKSQLGYSENEIANAFEEWSGRLHPDDSKLALQLLGNYLANPRGMYRSEFRLRHRDGSYRWILAQGSIVTTTGHPRSMFGSHLDITERVLAEQAVRLRDRAIQAVSQGIIITDPNQPDNPIIFASPGAERLTGYSLVEMLGRNCRFLQGERTDRQTMDEISRSVRSGKDCSVEILNYRKDGTTFWNALFITPVRDDAGNLVHFIGVQADVTERRNLEEQVRQAQKMEAIGQLAGGVAHDFNNMLTVITGYCEILLSMLPSSDGNREAVRGIQEAGERAALLTRHLLAFSRKAVLEPQILDINAVVQETEKMLRRLIGEDVLLTTDLAPRISNVKVDPGQLGQVLINLAVNARDAMPTGGTLTIETRDLELDEVACQRQGVGHPGRYVQLAVRDNGLGMTSEVMARIFEPFFTTKDVGKGTGLGLAVVYGIVKQSCGWIGVASEPGRGTSFLIRFPAVELSDGKRGSNSSHFKPSLGTESVLVVEDEAGVRDIAQIALQMYGYKVFPAKDANEAIVVAGDNPSIDILVTDLVMPGMCGRELADVLQRAHPGLKVLFMSGYTDDAVIRHGLDQDRVAFLSKPFSPLALVRKVRAVLDDGIPTAATPDIANGSTGVH